MKTDVLPRLPGRCKRHCVEKWSLDYDTFWNNFNVTTLPGDGHCLLHAVIKSFTSQRPDKGELSKEKLVRLMSHETCENSYRYVPLLGSREVLLLGLTYYVRLKIYDSDFGDIVPLILCNTLKLNIEILYMDGDCYNSGLVINDTGTQTSSDFIYL